MRSVLIKAATLALMFLHAATVARAGVDVRRVSETNGQIVVQLDNHELPNVSPRVEFYVAISPTGAYSASFQSGPAPTSRSGPVASAALDTLTLSDPFMFRGSRVVWVEVQIPPATATSHVTITYAPAASYADASTADPLVRALVVNETVFPFAAMSGAPQPFFSLAGGWAKLPVTERGVYAVTGSDLTGAGINLGAIDPATIRVFTQGGINQPREFADPEGSWQPGMAMREIPVRVEAGSDGTFDPGDRVIFYGLGARDWENYYDPTAPDSVYHKHTHAKTNYYFLAWGGSLPGSAARMPDVDGTPTAAPDLTTYTEREYREQNLIADFDYRGDGWLWLDIDRAVASKLYNIGEVQVRDLVTSVPQEIQSIALARVDTVRTGHHVVYRAIYPGSSTAVPIGGKVWDSPAAQRYYETGLPYRFGGNFLTDGTVRFRLEVPGDLNRNDSMYFAWYAVRYMRRMVALNDAAGVSTPDTSGVVNVRVRGFSTTGTLYAFDVSDPWNPARLTGAEVTTAGSERTVRVAVSAGGTGKHVWVNTGPAFKTAPVTRITPVDLRAPGTGANMLIVTPAEFRSAGERLRAYRAAGRLPLFASPTVRLATVEDIYDNFSGGMPDPMAVRNYVKYAYDNFPDANGHPRLGYLLLLGDANEDFQNNASTQPNFVPSNLNFTTVSLYAFSTDEWFGQTDAGDQVPGHGILDIAIGRLPAASATEASFLVNKVMAYENEAPRDDWRYRTILVADDEESSQPGCETQWTQESELITRFHAAPFLDIKKIYLTEYPKIGSVKPTSRFAFLGEWNAGALVINYIGHGSSVQMADEQVFLGSDVSQLNNGLRLPIVMAFSCTIGDFANPAGKSLSEKLLLRDGGGAIATITASRETYPSPNSRVCFELFDRMFAHTGGKPPIPYGVALMQAKLFAQLDTNWQAFQEDNNWKYNLMGDPALLPAAPQDPIRFSVTRPDTLVAGVRRTLRGKVYHNGVVDTGFNGLVSVEVREPQVARTYITTCPGGIPIFYMLPGGPMYEGTVDAVNGEFAVNFRVPRYAATGPLAYAGAYAHEDSRDASVSMDSVLVVAAPTLADSLALTPVDGSPRVELGFKSGLQVVKPGDTVRARVADADGINILDTTNEGRQAILIDNLSVPIDVNQYFSFDHGGVDTSGVLLYPLPDLRAGRHRLVYKVSDSFGFTTLDTLQFDVTDPADYYAEAVFNYPNPFKDSTRFLFRVSNRASVKLEIYTVSGKFVRRIEEVHDGGEVWVPWDGRDGFGGEVANGSYLYVATFDFVGVNRPPVVLRGALSRIR